MSISNYLEIKILDKVFTNTDFTATAAHISLHTGDPGETGANEVAIGTSSYARQVGTFSAAAAGATENSAVVTFTSLPAGTVGFAGVWDATGTGGNFLWGGSLGTAKVVNEGDNFQFNVGDIDITLD